MHITENRTAWRQRWIQAKFRDAIFYVETDQRGGGRRVALHQYPKRNTPYAEDMGRTAVQFQVTGYCIGRPALNREARPSRQGAELEGGGRRPGRGEALAGALLAPARDYLTMKNDLIKALEQDGPGMLALPMQHLFLDTKVMVMGYTVTESREKGGMCMFQMQFVEYGDPRYRSTISTADEILKSAANVENVIMGLVEGRNKEQILAMLRQYTWVFNETPVDPASP